MMHTDFEPVIGLEVHAELETRSKMFCACPVVDSTQAAPNTAVCPVCAGMPGVLPVVNQRAVEYATRVALALGCELALSSIFARKNYFYPDLPKGYQISQYEQPLARNGRISFDTPQGERMVRIRRVHLEEDTGKLTHVQGDDGAYSLVDLNRAGVALLEIVSEPDLHSAQDVRLYAEALRNLMRYLEVNSGDMQKGILRIEPNISVRPAPEPGAPPAPLGTRTEIKNLNSFRALERAVDFEIHRQTELLRRGQTVLQETRGWDDQMNETVSQRSKEEAHDYRYFPEPDLPPVLLEDSFIRAVAASLPELPYRRHHRLQQQYGLSAYDASTLVAERSVADFFEQVVGAGAPAKQAANWITGELFAWMNQAGLQPAAGLPIQPQALAALIAATGSGEINQTTAKTVLAEMLATGRSPEEIIATRGLRQLSDTEQIERLVQQALIDSPEQVAAYLAGKESLSRWFFGQVMRLAGGQANPQRVQQSLERQLADLRRTT